MRVLIGGVGYRWQRDASFGLVLSDALAGCDWPQGVTVEDFGYGALYVAQDIAAHRPDRLILLSGMPRGREPGRLTLTRSQPVTLEPQNLQARISEAGAGVIDLDHLLHIAQHFGALPADVLLVEFEPFDASGGVELSPAAALRLPGAAAVVRREALAAAAAAPAERLQETRT